MTEKTVLPPGHEGPGADSEAPPPASGQSSPTGLTNILAAQAEKVAKRNADDAEKLRASAGLWGKVLAGAMTTALGWITLKSATDIYPSESGGAQWAALIALIAMASSIVLTWWWFNRMTRPLAMGLNIENMRNGWNSELSEVEANEVARIYGELGALNKRKGGTAGAAVKLQGNTATVFSPSDATTLIVDYAMQAVEADREVEEHVDKGGSSTDEKVAHLVEKAARIRAEVYATQQRAMVAVIRRRIGGLTSGVVSSLCLLLFVGGLLGLSYSLDYLDAERAESATALTGLSRCATTVGELAKNRVGLGSAELPPECSGLQVRGATVGVTVSDVQALAGVLEKCRATTPAGQTRPECDALAAELSALVQRLPAG
ncbi:hypothetical protein ACFQNE_05285 [Gordonia phosphorivorans]|uniref:Uncharacterized protein n=1 Tax=Gordonia phosphorivorans TaxID=1056982 RepID=A0ABV6H5C0_9ACTN